MLKDKGLELIDGTLDALNIDELSLGVYDAGGPIGMYWAAHNLERVRSLALPGWKPPTKRFGPAKLSVSPTRNAWSAPGSAV